MTDDLTHISLFTGIGGFDLAAEWAGFRTIAMCEIDPFCQEVLRSRFPSTDIFGDIKDFRFAGDSPTLITAGFPCQDISASSSTRTGISGERSGLWKEAKRIIGGIRPRWVLLENSPMLLKRGIGVVLGDLAEVGYDAEWHCISASRFGYPHIRDRIWIVAHSNSDGLQGRGENKGKGWGYRIFASFPIGEIWDWRQENLPEPKLIGSHDGFPNRVDRTKALGNAIVPEVAYQIIKAIAEIERQK